MIFIYNWFIKWRFYVGIAVFVLGVWINLVEGIGVAWILYLTGLLLIIAHFLFGTLRLIQSALEQGNIPKAEKTLRSIWFPKLLIRPVRSVYYTIQGNIAMSKKDFSGAETLIKKGLDIGMPMKEAEGSNLLQMSMLATQRGNTKEAESYVRSALSKGLPDKESQATAYLQMCSIMMNKRQFKAAKDFFRKAKELKPTTPEIVQQIREISKYISRIPG